MSKFFIRPRKVHRVQINSQNSNIDQLFRIPHHNRNLSVIYRCTGVAPRSVQCDNVSVQVELRAKTLKCSGCEADGDNSPVENILSR